MFGLCCCRAVSAAVRPLYAVRLSGSCQAVRLGPDSDGTPLMSGSAVRLSDTCCQAVRESAVNAVRLSGTVRRCPGFAVRLSDQGSGGGMQVAWRGRSHLEPPARAQVAHVLQPSRQVWRGGAGGLEGGEALGATRALTWPQAAFGIYSRCFLHCFAHGHRRRKPSAPGAFCTVLPMSTGGVSHLLQVLFALFCPCPQAA